MSARSLRRRILPAPATSVALTFAWVALQGQWSVAGFTAGALLGIVLPLCMVSLVRDPRLPNSLSGSLALLVLVCHDIIVANIDVAWRVLGPERVLRPTFVWVPLDLETPEAIALLASIITLTPGTLSADLSRDRRQLLVHVLHAPEPEAVVKQIKSRYETRLQRLFEARNP